MTYWLARLVTAGKGMPVISLIGWLDCLLQCYCQ